MAATVVVVGGGYGGITAAQALDESAEVVLIDPKDAFVHNVASLRAAVDASWADRMFLPYGGLLKRGRVLRDWAVSVGARRVWLSGGGHVDADYIVIATGTDYPFPAKVGSNSAAYAQRRFRDNARAIAAADRILLLGAGPVGLELAGEIAAAWPRKSVTLLDPASQILSRAFHPGFDPDVAWRMRLRLLEQLGQRGIGVLPGTSLRHDPDVPPGTHRTFAVGLSTGQELVADLWLRCYGRQPMTRVLSNELAMVRRFDDLIEVEPDLRLRGQRRVFAIGDVAATGAMDTAVVAIEQGELVAENIKTLLAGGTVLKAYEPAQPFLSIPLGRGAGVTYIPGTGLLDAEPTTEIKGADLLIGKYREIFGMSD